MHQPLQRLVHVVQEFRKLDPEMQAQQIAVFLEIALKPEITMRDLEIRTGLGSSTISRNVAALSKVHRKGRPGHDLVSAYEDPNDRRYKRVRLTHKGQLVISTLLNQMDNLAKNE